VFENHFKEGVRLYLEGSWDTARIRFETCLYLKYDHPTTVLLQFLASYNYKAPLDWSNCRSLMSKS